MICEEIIVANTFFKRLAGLMGKDALPRGTALMLAPCCQVHTLFMKFHIDVIFLDRQYRVRQVIENLPPWRISGPVRKSRMVVELAGGTLQKKVAPGDLLEIRERCHFDIGR
jgi:uncharacterized membrane protein (UPF0127 family)